MRPLRLLGCLLLAVLASSAAAQSQQDLRLARGVISSVDGNDGVPVAAAAFHIQDHIYYFSEVRWDDPARPAGTHQLLYKWYSGATMALSFGDAKTFDTAPYHWFAYVTGGHLGEGHHRVELYVDGKLFDTREFDIVPAAVATGAAAPAGPDEAVLRKAIRLQGRDLLLRGDTEGFDRLADGFRQGRERTAAGIWKLSLLYNCPKEFELPDPADARGAKLEETAARWVQERPDSPAAVIMAAKIFYYHAWAWRGEDYAPKVGEDRWAPYREGIEQARRMLDAHPEVAARDPEWDAVRINLASEQGADGEEIFTRAGAALGREAYYYPIHYAAARALLPRWHGSEELVQRYVQLALEHSRAKEGEQAYARIYFDLALKSSDPLNELNGTGAKWPAMQQSLDEIRRAWPDPYNLEIERVLACYAGDAHAYQALGPRSGVQPGSVGWLDTPQRRQDCDDWAFKNKQFADQATPMERVQRYVSFLHGFGSRFWAAMVLTGIGAFIALELAMWRLAGGGWRAESGGVISPWGGARFEPARYPRSYRFSGMAQPVGNHLAIAMLVLGAAVVRLLASVPWSNPAEGWTVTALFVLLACGGALAIARNVTRKLVLQADAIELHGLFGMRRLRRDEIAGYRLELGGDTRQAVVLVPRAAPLDGMRISAVARTDEAYAQWFASLPGLDGPAPWLRDGDGDGDGGLGGGPGGRLGG